MTNNEINPLLFRQTGKAETFFNLYLASIHPHNQSMTTIPLTQTKITEALKNLRLHLSEMEIWAAHDPEAAYAFHEYIEAGRIVEETFIGYSGEVEKKGKIGRPEQFELDLGQN